MRARLTRGVVLPELAAANDGRREIPAGTEINAPASEVIGLCQANTAEALEPVPDAASPRDDEWRIESHPKVERATRKKPKGAETAAKAKA